MMNPAYLSALAALSGSAVSGLTSFLSPWLGQSTQLRAQAFLNNKSRRQELYRDDLSCYELRARTHFLLLPEEHCCRVARISGRTPVLQA
jgi:hypothetical protein